MHEFFNHTKRSQYVSIDAAVQKYPDAKPLFHSDRGFQCRNKLFRAKLDVSGM